MSIRSNSTPQSHQLLQQAGSRFYTPNDLEIAEIVFGANCGPAALAASLSRNIADIMRFFPQFEDENKRYTTLTTMKSALQSAAITFQLKKCELPTKGLALIQWLGPWTKKHFFSRWSLCYTHWIAVDGEMIYDILNGRWQPLTAWETDVAPVYLAELAQAAGWAVKYGIEVENLNSCWQESFLELLFRRPSVSVIHAPVAKKLDFADPTTSTRRLIALRLGAASPVLQPRLWA